MVNIKAFTLCVLVVFTALSTLGQETWTSFLHKINTKGYEGLTFRYQALVRTEVQDDSASAHLWARVDKANGVGYFENMMDRPIRNREWKTYTLEGKIDTNAHQIAFGVICIYNGEFYFDDLKLDIETKKGIWTNVFKADFENGDNTLKQGLLDTAFKASIVQDAKGQGKNALQIKATDVPNFGVNSKAGKYADVNGIKLYYEIYGEGQPLLILHGNGGSIIDASPFYTELMKKYKVIAVDSRAHGRSGDTDGELTYDLMASDVNALLDQLNIDSVFIWGQSDGAILGLLLAMDYPKKVKRVLAFGSNIQTDSTAIFPWVIERMSKIMKESKDQKKRKLNGMMLKYPNIPYAQLSRIKAPVLIMAGDRDAIRPEHSLRLFQSIPNSHLCILPGTTHGASWEKQELFLKLLDEFFNKPFTMPDTKDWLN